MKDDAFFAVFGMFFRGFRAVFDGTGRRGIRRSVKFEPRMTRVFSMLNCEERLSLLVLPPQW